MLALPQGAAETAPDRRFAAGGYDGVAGQVGSQLRGRADRTHSGAATAMRNREGLVQVDVNHVRAVVAGAAQPHLRIEVGAVQIHVAAVLVNDFTNVPDLLLEDAVSGRVGHHHRGEAVGVLRRLDRQILDIDVAPLVAADHYDLHSGQNRAGRVGAVCRRRDQADIAMLLSQGVMAGADHEQARVLSLRSRIGLQRYRGETADFRQPVAQIGHDAGVSPGLFRRRKGMQLTELGPRDRGHLRRRIQLHGARAERDHAGGQREVPRLEAANVAQASPSRNGRS